MCRRITCRRCGKAGWSGCGAHVSQVMAGVPGSTPGRWTGWLMIANLSG